MFIGLAFRILLPLAACLSFQSFRSNIFGNRLAFFL